MTALFLEGMYFPLNKALSSFINSTLMPILEATDAANFLNSSTPSGLNTSCPPTISMNFSSPRSAAFCPYAIWVVNSPETFRTGFSAVILAPELYAKSNAFFVLTS